MRTFENHIARQTLLLNGKWDFITDAGGIGTEEKWFQQFPGSAGYMIVPSCWNNEMGLYLYEGDAWYHKKIRTVRSNYMLAFNAVAHECFVYFDGEMVCHHYGGFSRFEIPLENVAAGEHSVTLRVNNTHNREDTIPQPDTDWMHYGGIIRDVELSPVGDAYIKNLFLKYELDVKARTARMSPLVKLFAFTDIEDTLVLKRDGKICSKLKIAVKKGENTIEMPEFDLKRLSLWSPENRALYTFEASFAGDDLIDRTGFRTVEIIDKRVCINKKPVVLKGVNRHEEHPDWGFAFPPKLMKADINIIKDLGCNAIRGAHNAPDEFFMDLLDEEGLLMWSELPMAGHGVQMGNPILIERACSMTREMIERDFNKPSIIIWSMFNECATWIDEGVEMARRLRELIRSLDTSRLITYATHEILKDRCLEFADFVSVNKYYGWYNGPKEGWHGFLAAAKKKMADEGVGDKPLMITEYGGAAMYGDTGFEDRYWSEQHQADILDYATRAFLADPDIGGMYIWQFCDARTCMENFLKRPRVFNNKGILNEYRKPKLAYWAVQKVFKGEK